MTHADSILQCWHAASAQDLADGLAWYGRAEQLAEALAVGTDYTVRQTAAVIAALSPRTAWPTNVAGATTMVRAATGSGYMPKTGVPGFPANREKAWRILMGEDPDDVLGGDKVRSFFANITGDSDAVTVDVWAARAAGAERTTFTPKQYAEIADAYRDVAKLVGHTPREVQAAVWTYVRRITLRDSATLYWIIDRKDF